MFKAYLKQIWEIGNKTLIGWPVGRGNFLYCQSQSLQLIYWIQAGFSKNNKYALLFMVKGLLEQGNITKR